MEFVETPLDDVFDYLKDLHHIEVQFDEKALRDAEAAIDIAVSCDLNGIQLKSALELILDEWDLAYVVKNDVLHVTTAEKADGILQTRSYPVRDLVLASPAADPDFKPLIDTIRSVVAPHTWSQNGGAGTLQTDAKNLTLVCTQSPRLQRQVAQLLADLLAAPEPRKLSRCESRIAHALNEPTSLVFTDTPLNDVVRYLHKLHKIGIQFYQRSLDEAGVANDTPVTCDIQGVPLKSALDRLLKPLDLDYVVRNEVLLITSQETADSILDTEVYPVRDLLPLAGENSAADFEPLIANIKANSVPRSWMADGPGTIAAFPPKSALVCTQTRRVHDQIERALARMRNAKNPDHQRPNEIAESKLEENTSLEFDEVALTDVIDLIKERHQVEIQFHKDARDEGFEPAVTCSLKEVPLKVALTKILTPIGLAYDVENGVIRIVKRKR